jgi:hypothetical protein
MPLPVTFVAGDILEASQLNDNFNSVYASYTAYTPTVTGWTLGNGTASGNYSVTGNTVNYYGYFLFGSTSAIGASSTLTVTLPFTYGGAVAPMNGICKFVDTSAGVGVAGYGETATTTLVLQWLDPETAPLAVRTENWNTAATMPFTFANGDYVYWNITYRKA